MTDILFPAFEPRFKFQRRLVYATFCTDIARSTSDAIDALELFRGLLYGLQKGPNSVGYMAFDPHGGETGCHLRAGMVLELFAVHRQMAFKDGTPLSPVWIDRTIQTLRQAHERAKDVCTRLTKKREMPSKMGLDDRQDTPARILGVLGWKEAVFDKYSGSLYACAQAAENSPGESASRHTQDPVPSLSLSEGLTTLVMNDGGFRPTDGGSSSSSADSFQSTSSTSTGWTSPIDDAFSPVQAQWDLHDSRVVIRTVVYSYVLSKYKVFYCLKSNVGARLCPEAAAKYQYEVMEDYWNLNNTDYRKAKLDRVGSELRKLQVWMSNLTCAWLQVCAMRYPVSGPMTR